MKTLHEQDGITIVAAELRNGWQIMVNTKFRSAVIPLLLNEEEVEVLQNRILPKLKLDVESIPHTLELITGAVRFAMKPQP